jgi:hypothetical protein
MKPKRLLPNSQEPLVSPYREPHESHPHPPIQIHRHTTSTHPLKLKRQFLEFPILAMAYKGNKHIYWFIPTRYNSYGKGKIVPVLI